MPCQHTVQYNYPNGSHSHAYVGHHGDEHHEHVHHHDHHTVPAPGHTHADASTHTHCSAPPPRPAPAAVCNAQTLTNAKSGFIGSGPYITITLDFDHIEKSGSGYILPYSMFGENTNHELGEDADNSGSNLRCSDNCLASNPVTFTAVNSYSGVTVVLPHNGGDFRSGAVGLKISVWTNTKSYTPSHPAPVGLWTKRTYNFDGDSSSKMGPCDIGSVVSLPKQLYGGTTGYVLPKS